MPRKIARFIKVVTQAKQLPSSGIADAQPVMLSKISRDSSLPPATAARIAPCVCRKKGAKWFCMKPDHTGRLLLVDGPFNSEQECFDQGVCG